MSRTTTSLRSVITPLAFFGHDTQQHAVGRDGVTIDAQFFRQPRGLGCEHMHHVERSLRSFRDRHAVGQLTDDIAIGAGKTCRKNAKARLDAELLHN
jgi:hypothetical protein